MDPSSVKSQRSKKMAYRVSELNARKRNNAAEESLREELSNLTVKEEQSIRLLKNETRNFLDSIQSVKLGRRKVTKSLTRNHITPSRSRSGSLTSACPQPRTCLADTYHDDSDDTETVKLPSINLGHGERYRNPTRPTSSALQRRRFSENDALVESLRRFHALRIDNQAQFEVDVNSNSSQPPNSQPPKMKVRGRSGSCFGRLISSPSTINLGMTIGKRSRDDDTHGIEVREAESIECREDDIILNFSEPGADDGDSKSSDNKSIDDSHDNRTDSNDDKVTTKDYISVEKIVPQIVVTGCEKSSSIAGDSESPNERKDSHLLCAEVKRRSSRAPSAKSDWSRNRPLREARKKNTAVLPSTFAALSMSRRFSSPDPAEDAVRAQQMFLEKLNRRRRSEQTELAKRVNEFLKRTTPSVSEVFTNIDSEVSPYET